MTVVWIVLAIALVAVVIGGVVIMRRRGSAVEERASPESLPEERREPSTAAPPQPAVEDKPAGGVERESGEAPVRPEPAAPPKPEPSPEELRAEVETVLSESDRMLEELRELSGGEDESVAEMADVLGEGLQEVRTLASQEKWAQAKDKGEALRSQLVMMLRSARRDQDS